MTFDGWRDLAAAVLAGHAGLFTRFSLGCVAFIVIAAALRRTSGPAVRAWGQVVATVVLFAILSTPVIAACFVGYAIVFYLAAERIPRGVARTTTVGLLLAAQVGLMIFWIAPMRDLPLGVRELLAYTTNLTFLRAWAWAFDPALEIRTVRDYALYTFFFPGLVSGPFFSPSELGARRRAWYWDPATTTRGLVTHEGHAFLRVLTGILVVAGSYLVVPLLSAEAYRSAISAKPLGVWAHAIGVYLGVYVGFTAWTEASVGFGRMAGIGMPENFANPHAAYGIADFWRRWNMSLGNWMHHYIYLPLGGAHPGGRRDRLAWWNIAAVFLAVALYHHIGGLKLLGPSLGAHGQFWLPWLLWALINAAGTIWTRRWRRPATLGLGDVITIGGTFLVSCVALQVAFYPFVLPLRGLGAIVLGLLGLR